MKQQDKYPYDPTITAPKIIIHAIGRDSFYVNSNCILATDKIITKGKEYIIFDNTTDTGIKMTDVILVDCCYREGFINLIVQDIKSKGLFTIHNCLECSENDCKWVLIDINYFIDKMNDKAIRQYCGNCNDPQKKANSEINHKSNCDDLLEFEF